MWFWFLVNNLTCTLKSLEIDMSSVCRSMTIWNFLFFFFLMIKKLILTYKKPKLNQTKAQNKTVEQCRHLLLREWPSTPVNPLSPEMQETWIFKCWWHPNNMSIRLPTEIASEISWLEIIILSPSENCSLQSIANSSRLGSAEFCSTHSKNEICVGKSICYWNRWPY